MIIVAEGLDNLGKTTFAKALHNKLGFTYYDYPIPAGRNEYERMENAIKLMMDLNDREDIVMDRSIISSMVYHTIPFYIHKLPPLFYGKKILVFLPYNEEMKERVLEDDDMKNKDIKYVNDLIKSFETVANFLKGRDIFVRTIYVKYKENFNEDEALKYIKYLL